MTRPIKRFSNGVIVNHFFSGLYNNNSNIYYSVSCQDFYDILDGLKQPEHVKVHQIQHYRTPFPPIRIIFFNSIIYFILLDNYITGFVGKCPILSLTM